MKKHRLYINGEFVESTGEEFIDIINPSTEEVLSQIPKGQVEDVKIAINAADEAQESWEETPGVERGKYLHQIAEGIRSRSEEIADIIVKEGGKTQELAMVETNFTADYMDYMAEWARRYEGDIIPSDDPNEHILLYKKAIGVTTGILPWNFPFFLLARKMAPALITGNTIVIKPSELTSNNAIAFAEIVHEVGLPKGVFNLVTGKGAELGHELSANSKVGLVSITGSERAGKSVMKAASENVTKVNLELGGKAPAIVLNDADVDLAVKAVVDSRVINTGQVCNCAERLYVQRDIKDVFTEKLVKAMNEVKYANPSDNNNLDMGPLISEQAQDRVKEMVDQSVSEGAKVLCGGNKIDEKGYFFEPTIIDGAENHMDIMQKEIFGPVIPMTTFDTLDEAIDLANDNKYGLTSSVYTKDINKAMKAVEKLKFGETYINRENFEAMQGFHAGTKRSGIGGADGKHGLEEYLQTHVVYLRLDKSVQ